MQTTSKTSRACERSTLTIKCNSGTISVVSANYGRLSTKFCPGSSRTNCRAKTSLDVVQKNCQGKSSCSVRASNDVFGDPCVGVQKYLEVEYKCNGELCFLYLLNTRRCCRVCFNFKVNLYSFFSVPYSNLQVLPSSDFIIVAGALQTNLHT